MEIGRYSVPEPQVGTAVWCCVGWENPTNGNMDALTTNEAIDRRRYLESDGIERIVNGRFNPHWVKRVYLGNFYASASPGSEPEWYRYICREEWFDPTDLHRSLSNSFTMADDEYRRRFNADFKKFKEHFSGSNV